jgi:integrase
VRDKRYRETALAHDVVDWLASLELGGAAERTLDQYERDLARLCLLFPDKGLHELTDADIAHCLTLFSPKQRRVRAAAIQSFWKWAVRTRRAEKNPMDTLPVIKAPPQKYIETFTDAEVEALQALPPVDAIPMKLLFESGIRKGEARALRLADILPDPPPGRLVILGGKGGKDRVIPVTEGLARAVAELTLLEGLENQEHLWYGVHANASGRKLLRHRVIAEGTFHRWWGRCIETAGVRYRNPTSRGTPSRRTGSGGAGGWKRSRSSWATRASARPSTCTGTWTRETPKQTSRSCSDKSIRSSSREVPAQRTIKAPTRIELVYEALQASA